MRVLITGGLGFVGATLAARLRSEGAEVTVVDDASFNGIALSERGRAEVTRRERDLTAPQSDTRPVGIARVDVTDGDAIRRVVTEARPTHVVHLAGVSRVDVASREAALTVHANVMGTQRVLDAVIAAGDGARFVLASSSMVYGNFEGRTATEAHPCAPVEPYGASKLAAEELVRACHRRYELPIVILRPSAVYGPGDFNGRVVQRFIDAGESGEPLVLTEDGRELLDFTFIDDVVAAFRAALTAPDAIGEAINVTFGEARSVLDLARIVATYIPRAVLQTRAAPSDRPRRGTLCIGKARQLLGFDPLVALEEGVRRTIAARGMVTPSVAIARVGERPVLALAAPSIDESDVRAVGRALRSGWLTHGPENAAFEQEFATMVGRPHALSLNSCASALILALSAAGIRGEVLVPSFTFIATANAVVLAGATPVFVDVDDDTMGMSAEAARACIGPRTEAILAVHLGGLPCRMGPLVDLARAHGLLLIEDAAQAAGARLDGVALGGIGDLGCFSFFPTKTMTTGEGGMLVGADEALLAKARALAAHGIPRGTAVRHGSTNPWERRATLHGWNFRMSAMQAALGRSQLARLGAMNAARKALASQLSAALEGTALGLPRPLPGAEPAWSMYMTRVPSDLSRDAVVTSLRARGVDASVHWDRAVPREPSFADRPTRADALVVADRIAREVMSLPLHVGMASRDIDRVAAEVVAVLDSSAVRAAQ